MAGDNACGWYSTAEEATDGVDGKGLTAFVTGGTSGIGTEIARVLALRGVHVYFTARNMEAGRKIKDEIVKGNNSAQVDVLELDLNSLDSVHKAAESFLALNVPLNILVNNAGIMMVPYQLSKDGIESQFAVNHIGHFCLTNLLLENMKQAAQASGVEGRIVNVASLAHVNPYKGGILPNLSAINDRSSYRKFSAYGSSKLANILHANELARLFKEEGVNLTANSVHPGTVYTNLLEHTWIRYAKVLVKPFTGLFVKTVAQGAATPCYVALNPAVKGVSGEYFSDCKVTPSGRKEAKDPEQATRLWELSEQIVAEVR